MADVIDFDLRLKEVADKVTVALDHLIPPASGPEADLMRAMRHAALANGKRMRPFFLLEAGAMFDAPEKSLLRAAAALECVHCYSLVHDDLPCMDDDNLRRGKPTTHVLFGENVAVLAGDALLTEAFAIIAQTPERKRYRTRDYVTELASTSDSRRLIGGQIMDLEGEGKALTRAQLVRIHEAKTAALLTSSLRLGGMSANASASRLQSLTDFGKSLGLAFQVIDDILDVTQSTEKLGKTAGKDATMEKATYPAILGLEKSRQEAQRLTRKALTALHPLGRRAARLHQIAHYLLDRDY